MYNELSTLGLTIDNKNITTSDVNCNTSTQSKITKHQGNFMQEKSELLSFVRRDLRLAQHGRRSVLTLKRVLQLYTSDEESKTSAHKCRL